MIVALFFYQFFWHFLVDFAFFPTLFHALRRWFGGMREAIKQILAQVDRLNESHFI